MRTISQDEVLRRLRLDNPWWESPALRDDPLASFARRDYFDQFASIVRNEGVRRAVVLVGPRRVGKTVMVGQLVRQLLADGVDGASILYLSLDTPLYTDLTLEDVVGLFREEHGHAPSDRLFIFFDEVQYHKDWERHLKVLVDTYPNVRFVATGSAAAALKRQSQESGAGRFTDYLLPPLTFSEFLAFVGRDREEGWAVWDQMGRDAEEGREVEVDPAWIAERNRDFVDYLNFGGYPEAVLSEVVRGDSARFVRDDIIGKVLLRDLPSLYGITDTQELNRLFMMLAYNTANEVGLSSLAEGSGITKSTINRYLSYLEAAFLVRRVVRVDDNARHLARQRTFKVYLTNPSMRGALFGYVDGNDPATGYLAETAVFSQLLHAPTSDLVRYARWKEGRRDCEVDVVELDRATQKPWSVTEVKWTDRPVRETGRIASAVRFAEKHGVTPIITSRCVGAYKDVLGHPTWFVPTALLAQIWGDLTVDESLRGRAFGRLHIETPL